MAALTGKVLTPAGKAFGNTSRFNSPVPQIKNYNATPSEAKYFQAQQALKLK